MKNTVIFSNWTSINQIVNHIDPERKARGSAIIRQVNGHPEVVGYEITIYKRSNILYKVKVDLSKEDKWEWSLSTEEAVEFLNQLGFRCEYHLPEYYNSLTDRQYNILKSLKELGYSHIVRYTECGQGYVIALKSDSFTDNDQYDFSSFSDYNYLDWIFLELGQFILIDSILEANSVH